MVQFPHSICAKLLFCSLLGFSVAVNQEALAGYRKSNNSSNDFPQAKSSNVAATRGTVSCSQNSDLALTTLAPESHTGQTTSTAPTFAWYVPFTNPSSLKFIVYEYDSASYQNVGKKLLEMPMITRSGIMTYSLPATNSWLEVGKKYIWEVEVLCNSFNPIDTVIINSEILVVAKPDLLVEQINSNSDRFDKANVYAKAGLWYDALAEVARQPENRRSQVLMAQFLQQLAAVEGNDTPIGYIGNKGHKGEQLNQIAQFLQNN